ncbi:acyl-CoA thioesterase [Leptospira biflexa]|uniref:acyl-CoA thioesterase n=1 Tax=Leptospira biflexa TaxID=172 RepID=UPI001090ED09|nr:acyl-CoA thioesterase [Leptospira biflexa]TGM47305.1 acyl-CoA thioesterase [Leptospira biflexa]TGM50229.1 acyl-CoA thioesterase [Leptospira biflexa]
MTSPNELSPKSPQESAVETRHIVLPNDANHYGTAFGGAIMSWIDLIAAMSAQRHSGREAVTVSIDRINFITPIQIGDHVNLKAMVNYVGTTSMEVGVQVNRENPYTGEMVRATTAYLSFVALDENKKPAPVPPLKLETDLEKRRFAEGKMRIEMAKEFSAKIKASRKIL